MNNQITKIKNISNSNYQERGREIANIVIGMTNNIHSGYAYATSYKSRVYPHITYNYVIDKRGNIYQIIPDEYAGFCITTSNTNNQISNKESISICFMPTWGGDSYDYDSGDTFPPSPETNYYFLLTKPFNKSGKSYKTGLYVYDGAEWVLDEEVDIQDIRRPYESDNWSIEEECEESLIKLIKYLQVKYDIPIGRVFRIYDFYRTYNPAPYLNGMNDDDRYGRNEMWEELKDRVVDSPLTHFITIEDGEVAKEEVRLGPPISTVEDVIEKYGPDAGKDKDQSFKGNAMVDVSQMPGNKFTFELGIHDTIQDTGQITNDNAGNQVAIHSTNLWHIGNSSRELRWTTHIEEQCDELTFQLIDINNEIKIKEGWNVGYWISGVAGFNGNVFKLHQSGLNREIIDVTCFGWGRYLKSEGWVSFVNKTASQIFEECCILANIPHRVIDASSYVCKAVNCHGKTYYEAVQDAINETLVYEKRWYVIQPNFGVLEFRDILNPLNIKQLKFSEGSAILNWDFDSSIDESANMIVTYVAGESDPNTGAATATATGAVKDESSIKEWGRLQKVMQDSTGKADETRLNVSAENWLTHFNSPRRTLKLTCLGIPGLLAGNIIYVEIYDVVSVGTIRGCLVVDDCTHIISGDKHTLELTCEIVQDKTLQAIIYNANKENNEQKTETTLLEYSKAIEQLEEQTSNIIEALRKFENSKEGKTAIIETLIKNPLPFEAQISAAIKDDTEKDKLEENAEKVATIPDEEVEQIAQETQIATPSEINKDLSKVARAKQESKTQSEPNLDLEKAWQEYERVPEKDMMNKEEFMKWMNDIGEEARIKEVEVMMDLAVSDYQRLLEKVPVTASGRRLNSAELSNLPEHYVYPNYPWQGKPDDWEFGDCGGYLNSKSSIDIQLTNIGYFTKEKVDYNKEHMRYSSLTDEEIYSKINELLPLFKKEEWIYKHKNVGVHRPVFFASLWIERLAPITFEKTVASTNNNSEWRIRKSDPHNNFETSLSYQLINPVNKRVLKYDRYNSFVFGYDNIREDGTNGYLLDLQLKIFGDKVRYCEYLMNAKDAIDFIKPGDVVTYWTNEADPSGQWSTKFINKILNVGQNYKCCHQMLIKRKGHWSLQDYFETVDSDYENSIRKNGLWNLKYNDKIKLVKVRTARYGIQQSNSYEKLADDIYTNLNGFTEPIYYDSIPEPPCKYSLGYVNGDVVLTTDMYGDWYDRNKVESFIKKCYSFCIDNNMLNMKKAIEKKYGKLLNGDKK